MALSGFGIYSLVVPNVITSFLVSLYLFKKSSFRPVMRAGWAYWPRIFAYSKNIMGTRILGRLANEGDTLIVGKMLSLEALGVYSLAFRLANILNAQILPVITSISLPVLADSRDDLVLMRERFFKMISFIAFVIVPIGGAMIVFGDPLIRLLYGARWVEAVLPFKILTVFAVFRAISSPSSGLYNAAGRPDLGFKFTLWFVPFFLLAVYFSSSFGLLWLVITVTVVRVFGGFINSKLALKTINSYLISLYKSIAAIINATVFISILVILLNKQIALLEDAWILSVIIYIVFTLWVYRYLLLKNSILLSLFKNSDSWVVGLISRLMFIKQV